MKSSKTLKRVRNIRLRSSSSTSNNKQSQKVTFTKMTSEEHRDTRIKVYPYLIP